MFRRKLYTKLTLPINPGDGNSFAIKELLKSKSKVFPEESLEVTVLNKDDLSFENKWVRERLFPIFEKELKKIGIEDVVSFKGKPKGKQELKISYRLRSYRLHGKYTDLSSQRYTFLSLNRALNKILYADIVLPITSLFRGETFLIDFPEFYEKMYVKSFGEKLTDYKINVELTEKSDNVVLDDTVKGKKFIFHPIRDLKKDNAYAIFNFILVKEKKVLKEIGKHKYDLNL